MHDDFLAAANCVGCTRLNRPAKAMGTAAEASVDYVILNWYIISRPLGALDV